MTNEDAHNEDAHNDCSAVMRFAGCGDVPVIEGCAAELHAYRAGILPENWAAGDIAVGHAAGVISDDCSTCYDDRFDKFEWSALYYPQEMQAMCVSRPFGLWCSFWPTSNHIVAGILCAGA